VGGDKFAVEIAGPFSKGATPAVVKDNCDGTYDVTWHTDAAGNYLINAQLDGFAVGGCPVRCTGVSPSSAMACRKQPSKQITLHARPIADDQDLTTQGPGDSMQHKVCLICTVALRTCAACSAHRG